MQKRKWNFGQIAFVSLSVISIALVIIGFSIPHEDTGLAHSSQEGGYKATSVFIPEKVTFCGEEVPIQFFDVLESLEREITVNTYWHSQTIIYMKRANRYFPEIEKILRKNDIPEDFKYLAIAESGLLNLVSPAGAKGVWQVLTETAREYGLEVNNEVDERYNIEKSTEAACKYLKQSYNKYQNWTLSAASYNAGKRGVSRQLSRQKASDYYNLTLGEETGRYVFRIVAFKLIMESPEKYGFNIAKSDLYKPISYKEVTIAEPIPNIADFASEHGTNYKLLKILNPWLRENKLTNAKRKEYIIRIPKSNSRLL